MEEGQPMNDTTYFERLVTTTQRIARHPWHPGMQQAIDLAVEDVEGLVLDGRISGPQGDVLREILLSDRTNAA
jgi:hypothetical protein